MQTLTEQMRSIAKRIQVTEQPVAAPAAGTPSVMVPGTKEQVPTQPLKDPVAHRQLAMQLGLADLSTFNRAMQKVKVGQVSKLTRTEIADLAMAFVKLLALNPADTQKVMTTIKRISSVDTNV